MKTIARAAVLGAGMVGSGWAALFATHGVTVRIVDPDPAALDRARRALDDARALGVGSGHGAEIERASSVAGAVDGADWIQESIPERLPDKITLFAAAAPHVAPDAVVASSTSTFTPSALAHGCGAIARQLVIAHPLQPVYAVRVVELCASPATTPRTLERSRAVLASLGREPIVVRLEMEGLVANRLTAALLREALDLVARGVVSADDLDRLVAHGIATGWRDVGLLATEVRGTGGMTVGAALDAIDASLASLWKDLCAARTLTAAQRDVLRGVLERARRAGET